MKESYIHQTADVSKQAKIGIGTKVWNQCQIRENAAIGKNCILGKNVYIDCKVRIGNNVKIQNNSSIYFGSVIEDGVFIGPHVCLTNDKAPRAITKEDKLKANDDWVAGKILVKNGASIGACSVVLPDVVIGQFAMVGAGSVVTKNVPDFALVYGNPAELKGYVCKCGAKITKIEEKGSKLNLFCTACKEKMITK
ncbi:MAG: acyltransferase [Nanoarchaeota archaeon]